MEENTQAQHLNQPDFPWKMGGGGVRERERDREMAGMEQKR